MKDLKRLLDLFYQPTDTICLSDSKFAYHAVPIASVLTGEVTLVSPNTKVSNKTVKTEELTLLSINPVNGFRNDENVYRHQAFLFEIDVGNAKSQLDYVNSLGLPFSAAIWSGNKSIHFLTVLEEPVDVKTYRILVQWALNIATLCDQNCKNPSRCVRIPGVIRPDTGKEQKLIEIRSKVSISNFLEWLNRYEHLKPKERQPKKHLTNEDSYANLSGWVRFMLKNKHIDFGTRGRNLTWFAIFSDFAIAGYTLEESEAILGNYFVEEHDFKFREWSRTAQSAFEKFGR